MEDDEDPRIAWEEEPPTDDLDAPCGWDDHFERKDQ